MIIELALASAASALILTSPGGRVQVEVVDNRWSLAFEGRQLLRDNTLALELAGEAELLKEASIQSHRRRSQNRRIRIPHGKKRYATDHYNQLKLRYRTSGGHRVDVVFRCFDDAVAFRYEIPQQKGLDEVVIADERSSFKVQGDPESYLQYLEHYKTPHEHPVAVDRVSAIRPEALIDLPATFVWEEGTSMAITEASLRNYAGMSLMREDGALVSKLTPRPDGTKVVGTLPLKTPWRVVLVGSRIGTLIESTAVFCLNEPPEQDFGWVQPGKMTWSWWNGNVVEPGKPSQILSLSAQKQYIDFAADSGIAYHSVIADETDTPAYFQTTPGIAPGPDTDVTRVRPDLDLEGIRAYAEQRGVKLWTWVYQSALRGRTDEAFAAFSRNGYKGMMVDFFDHDDQSMVEFAEEILRAAARHKILIHLHGVWKPTGLERTYPNLMNHEGVLNLEYLKWSDTCTPEHTLRIAFTRHLAGPLDYHLGGFRAVRMPEFKASHIGPSVLGTRAHQLGLYVCFDNPNPMIADFPAAYQGQVGLNFLRDVPTWWDETRVVMAEVGKLFVVARRRGRTWYLGGISAGPPREIEVPMSFLEDRRHRCQLWIDAPESEEDPNQLLERELTMVGQDRLTVRLTTDGGFVAKLAPKK